MLHTHLAAAAVALSIGFGAAWKTQGWRHAAANAEAAQVAAEATRLRQQAATKAAERNDLDTSQALARARTAALDARGDLERLRNAAGAFASTGEASAAGCSDDGRLSRLAGLLSEGAGLVEEGGRRVDQLAAEKAALQRHAAEQR